jgi:uncharacterized small protein (DUF1192 family)
MSMSEDEKAPRKTSHEIGADLSSLSVAELEARIALLQAEIVRLQAEITTKSSSRNVAESLFRK